MKLLRYGLKGEEKPGLLDADGYIRSLASVIPDLSNKYLAPDELDKLKKINPATLPKIDSSTRIGPCVTGIGKFLCIGLNYRDHAKETGVEIPREPVVFSKATSAISGPNDDVIIPKRSKKTDWEVELGVVIGTPCKYVSVEKALHYVAGYCLINDISEREFQLEGTGQWIKGKSCDTFGPIGPWLVTKDEIPDPQNIDLWLEVDGHRYQQSNTREMAFSVAFIVSYLSQFFTLYPGDIISTGTPSGVGLGQKPEPFYLKPGQVMHLGATGLGEQTQKAILEV
jgi:2-keto-4-pentenoate hydratase/2-oxohepta-3-ene-1,7-dioic acid hydratase in catechol pathway